MPNITLSVSQDTFEEMKKNSYIRWSEVARLAIENKLENLKILRKIERIANKSKLTPKDAEELGRKVKKAAFERLMHEHNTKLKHPVLGNNKELGNKKADSKT
jgi:hypothetical protein